MKHNFTHIDFNKKIHKNYIQKPIKRNQFYINDIKTQYLNDYDLDDFQDYPLHIQNKMKKELKNKLNIYTIQQRGIFITTLKNDNKIGICGFLLYNIDDLIHYHLTFVLIDKNYQKNGLGTTLLKKLIEIFNVECVNDHKLINIAVKVEADKNLSFYLKNGFLTIQQTNQKYNICGEIKETDTNYKWLYYPSINFVNDYELRVRSIRNLLYDRMKSYDKNLINEKINFVTNLLLLIKHPNNNNNK